MSKVDWSKAPRDTTDYGGGRFWSSGMEGMRVYSAGEWVHTWEKPSNFKDHVSRRYDWPTEQRIDIVGTNGGDGMHYDEQREAQSTQKAKSLLPPTNDFKIEPSSIQNVYERVIVGKRGTGECVVDVYRVLDAFKTDSAAIDHAIKKLLCGGMRGNKDKAQDYLEAIRSIDEALALLNDKKVGV